MKRLIKRMLSPFPGLTRTLRRTRGQWCELTRGLVRLAQNGSYANRMYLVDDARKLIYLSMPKAANSSIKASLCAMEDVRNYHEVNHKLRGTGAYQRNINLADYRDYYTFTFVRDPFSRLVSLYQNKYHTDQALSGKPGDRLYCEGLYYDRYLLGYLRKDRGFKRFARRVCRIPDWLSDRHFASQTHLLGGSTPDYVGRYERLGEQYEALRARFALDPLPHYNQTGTEDWRDWYDPDTARRVYRRYRKDVEAFGYAESYRILTAKEEARP